MRKVLVTFVLAVNVAVLALAATRLSAQAAPSNPSQADTPSNQKVIKDPAEYNAYITALNTTDPAAKAAAMEAFIVQYPNSIVKIDALEQAMAAYQALGNQQKVQETATKILQINPDSVRALAIVTFIERATANSPEKAAKARQDAERGLAALPKWTKPAELNDADFAKQKEQMTAIFNGAAGFGALQAKDYAAARDYYLKSVKIDPSNLQDVYQLSLTYLEPSPVDLMGFWYAGKAINLAKSQKNDAAAQGIATYAKAKYKRYHGSNDGFDEFVASTASQTAPPSAADLAKAIPPKPTDCDIAADVVAKNDPGTLSFSDKEFILAQRDCGPKGKDAADKVWQNLQDVQKGGEAKLKINQVKVIAAASDTLDLAITDDNKAANKADLHVVMDKPLTRPPAVGSTIDIVGTISSYTPNPFMFTMEKGELPGATAKPPVRKPSPGRRPGGAHGTH